MSSRIAVLWLLLALLVPSALIVSLQHDLTDREGPPSEILDGYADGSVLQSELGTAPVTIVRARCLIRGVFVACLAIGGDHLEAYNLAVQFVAIWLALAATFAVAIRLMPAFPAGAATLLVIAFVPWGFLELGYRVSWPYDLPALAFAALGMWAIVTGRFVSFAVILALGTVNKETIVFLLPAYLIAAWPRVVRRAWVGQAVLLGAVFAIAYEVPRILDSASHLPTATFSAYDDDGPRWMHNARHLALQLQATTLENVYWILALHVAPLAGWRVLPRELRAIYLSAPVLLVPVFFVGNIYELRLYNELIPLGAIATTLVVWQRVQVRPS